MASSDQHPLTQSGFIRSLVESRAISEKDLSQFAMASQATFKQIFEECLRYKVKNVPFTNPENPIHQAIMANWPSLLEDALQLGEFEDRKQAMTSPNGRRLMDETGSAVHDLLELCIDANAKDCLAHLLHLGDTKRGPYRYGREWLYDTTRHVALTTGKLDCLFYLHDHDHSRGSLLPDPTPLYHTLLQRARSPATVSRLAARMPSSTNYRALVAAHCADRHSQPAVIDALAQLVPPGERARLAPALCAAASITHIAALDILLGRGTRAQAYEACRLAREPRSSAHFNPLFCALALPLPGRPSAPVLREFPSVGEMADRGEWEGVADERMRTGLQLRMTWRDRVRRAFEAMYVVVQHLGVNAVGDEFGRGEEEGVRDEMLDCAAMIYLFHLRTYFLANLPWLLEYKPALLDELLVPVKEGSWTAPTVWSTAGFIAAAVGGHGTRIGASPDEEGEKLVGLGQEKPTYTWRKGISAERVMAVTRAERVGMTLPMVTIWDTLRTPTTVRMAQRYLKVRAEDVTEFTLWHLLVAEERILPFECEEDNQWDWKFVSNSK